MLLLAAALAVAAPLAAQSDEGVAKTLNTLKEKNPSLHAKVLAAYGYAVFPSVGKGAIGVGGAHGKGFVYEQGTKVGKTSLTQVTVGLQLGGQAYSEILVFEDRTALDDFKRGQFEFDAQASAVLITLAASADLPYRKGVAVITMGKGGLMYEASVGGQKFSYKPL